MIVGSNIRKRRFELKMSQQELAEAMGYKTRSTISKIESGENDVSQKKLQKFAEVLDITVEELISGYSASSPAPSLSAGSTGRNRNIAVILAGGKSGRNRQNIPSQFLNVDGKPIIVYCMEVYQSHPMIDDIYVVCLKNWENVVKAYANQYGISKLKDIIPAGSSGILSLKNAFMHIKNLYSQDDFVVVQESTRPLVKTETISRLLTACTEKGSATICHSMRDYVQFDTSGNSAKYINRDTTIALQSPEAHRLSVMEDVFSTAARRKHPLKETCCTMLMYNLGYKINFMESNVNNIKIVREEDIAAVTALLRGQ